METITDVTALESERASVETGVTIKLGLDVHARQIVVRRQNGGLVPKPAQKKGWPEFLRWMEALAAGPVPVVSCYEAGPCGYGLHRQLTAWGITNHVVGLQRWDEQGRWVKTGAGRPGVVRPAGPLRAGQPRGLQRGAGATPEQEQRRARLPVAARSCWSKTGSPIPPSMRNKD